MSQAKSKVAFEMRKREVELARLLPTKLIKNPENLKRYTAIVDSIPELGLIEPLMVYPQAGNGENWLVLDGHATEVAWVVRSGVERSTTFRAVWCA